MTHDEEQKEWKKFYLETELRLKYLDSLCADRRKVEMQREALGDLEALVDIPPSPAL